MKLSQLDFTQPPRQSRIVGGLTTALLARRARSREGKPFDLAVERTVGAKTGARLPLPKGVTRIEEHINGVRVLRFSSGHADRGTVLAFHGGAYILNGPEMVSIQAARNNGPDVVSVDYRLAPENPYPAGQDDAMTVYQALLDTVGADRIVVTGDSAGGGLALTLLQAVAEAGLPMPAALVAMYPWGDLSLSGATWTSNRGRDILVHSQIVDSAAWYAGELALDDPAVSPMFGSFRDFPPTYMAVGDRDLLLDDVRTIATRMREVGVDVHLDVFPGAPHGFNAVPLAPGRQCNARARALIDAALPVTRA